MHVGIHHLGVGLETPPWCGPGDPPGVGLEAPLGVGLETLWVWSGEPPGVGLENPLARPLKLPLGCGPGNLQGMLGYTPPQRPARHAEIPPARHAEIHTPWRPVRHAGIPSARHAGLPPPLVDRQTCVTT